MKLNISDSLLSEISESIKGLDLQALGESDNQDRNEWLKERLGRFTSSEFHRLMGYEDKPGFPDGAYTYAKEKALELLTDFQGETGYKGDCMEWGSNTEEEACIEFMKKFDIEVSGFGSEQVLYKKGEHIGGTPDGVISSNGIIEGGIETKCPESKTHLYYIMEVTKENFKQKLKNYYWQCLGNMYVTGAKYWYFISYDPRYKKEEHRLFVIRLERNEKDLTNLRSRLSQAIKVKEEIINKLEKWETKIQL